MASAGRMSDGNTPAHAGKTGHVGGEPPNGGKYSRARGKDLAHIIGVYELQEILPRTRERLSLRYLEPLPIGNTPAHAGKTRTCAMNRRPKRKYSRARGKDTS